MNFHDLGAALEFWSHVDGWEIGFFDIEDVVSGQEFERRQVRVWASLETAGSLDPCRYVLTELSRELADRWPSSVDCTDDFVVFPAGYTDVVFENLSQTASAEVLQLLRGRGYLPEFEQMRWLAATDGVRDRRGPVELVLNFRTNRWPGGNRGVRAGGTDGRQPP